MVTAWIHYQMTWKIYRHAFNWYLTVYWLYVVDILFNLLQWNCHRWTSQNISWLAHLWSQVSITDTSYFKMEDRINSYGTWFIFKVSERWHASQIAERLLCNSIVISVCYIALYIHQTKVDETDGLTWWYLSASRGCRILVKQNSEFCWLIQITNTSGLRRIAVIIRSRLSVLVQVARGFLRTVQQISINMC